MAVWYYGSKRKENGCSEESVCSFDANIETSQGRRLILPPTMVTQSPVEEFSWNALISNFIGKHDGPEEIKPQKAILKLELEDDPSGSNEWQSSSDARDDVDSSPQRACTPFDEFNPSEQRSCAPFDEPSCVPFDERSCTPRTAAEMKMDLKNIREDIAEIVKEHNRVTRSAMRQGDSPNEEKCVHFALNCNPEAVASKEELEKPVMERKDDTLDYVFNLVEIAICGDKKSNIDEEIERKPKNGRMPDPVQLLREKSIFQTLNPGSPRKSRKRSSRSRESGESSEKSVSSTKSKTVSFDQPSTKSENSETSTSESVRTEVPQQETLTLESSTIEVSKTQVSTTEARELRALRLKAAGPTASRTSKSEVRELVVSMTEPPKANKTGEAATTAKLVVDVSAVGVPPTIPEEPSNSQESVSSRMTKEEKKKKFLEEVALDLLAEVMAAAEEEDQCEAETDESVSHAPQSTIHVDGSHDTVSMITDVEYYSHPPPRFAQTKPSNPSNTYSPSILKLQNKNSVSSALAAYNKKAKQGVNFGGSTHVLGKQGSSTTTLVRRNAAGHEQVVQLLAGLLAMGKSNNIDARTPRGVIFLASVVSFLFWPEDLPKNQMARKPKPAPVEEPAEKEVPSLLSLVGDKPKRTSSPMKRNRPRPQLSSRRLSAPMKKSFDV